MSISFGKIEHIILMGGSWVTAEFLKTLLERKIETKLYTSPRHYDDIVDEEMHTLEQVTNFLNVSTVVTEDINDDFLKSDITDRTLGISFGAAWVFNTETVALFNGRLLDFMGIALPKYRGGAHYTWQILSGNKVGACNLQVIHGGTETFHRGEIIKRRDYIFPSSVRTPQDYFDEAIKEEIVFLNDFLNEIKEEKDFPLVSLDESFSSYYPFLNTKIHGWINWSWNAEEIDIFICAFDNPYDGASTYLNGVRVHLKSSKYSESNETFHPFHSGLVYRCSSNAIYIAVKGGSLIVQKVINDSGVNIINKIKEGFRFTTPQDKLEHALEFNALYGPNGLENV